MQAYKFETTILEGGSIKIPEISQFKNHIVEVFLVIKPIDKEIDKKSKEAVELFLEKWTGFLKEPNSDNEKCKYLLKKYK